LAEVKVTLRAGKVIGQVQFRLQLFECFSSMGVTPGPRLRNVLKTDSPIASGHMPTTPSRPNEPAARTLVLAPDGGERFTIIGGGVRLLIDSESSGGRCCMFECPIPPGEGPPLHRHEREDELFYVLEGRFKLSIDGNEFIAERGSFACAPRGSVHAFRNVGSTPGLLHVTCTPGGLEAPFRAVRTPGPGSGRRALTPEEIMAEFGKYGVTFVGPPLAA
jgi:quercetin dioxygenase-like cupin family protein